jgi:hypothetical protein
MRRNLIHLTLFRENANMYLVIKPTAFVENANVTATDVDNANVTAVHLCHHDYK